MAKEVGSRPMSYPLGRGEDVRNSSTKFMILILETCGDFNSFYKVEYYY